MAFGKSNLASELVQADMDDDVQSDRETVSSAKLGLEFDLRDAIKDYCNAAKANRLKQVKNLTLSYWGRDQTNLTCLIEFETTTFFVFEPK